MKNNILVIFLILSLFTTAPSKMAAQQTIIKKEKQYTPVYSKYNTYSRKWNKFFKEKRHVIIFSFSLFKNIFGKR